jgi:hypothetical protein
VRVLAVADADSYLKWSAATLDRWPSDWDRGQVLLSSPIAPSLEQARAATGRPVRRLSLLGLLRRLRRDPPDVLLLACTGPTVALLAGLPAVTGHRRPVLVTGLPGISIPASARAVAHRRSCDLLIVHSRRERSEFTRLADDLAPGLAVALTGLPFLHRDAVRRSGDVTGRDVVFAAQAKVPLGRAEREEILLALSAVSPVGSAVVKVRALPGERQTHDEELPYADLWADLLAAGRVAADTVRFATGSMRAALDGARSLVTVSSTAALEAIDAGVPVVVLSDFGVSESLINTVFVDSGCLGDLNDLRAGRAHRPDPGWLADNYFHPTEEDDVVSRVSDLVARRATGSLPVHGRAAPWWRQARAAARLLLPDEVVRRLRSVRRQLGRVARVSR